MAILTISEWTVLSMALIIFTLLRNHHHHPSPELFQYFRLILCIETLPPYFSLPQPLATAILLYASMNLTTLVTTYKLTHTIFVF